MYWQGETYTFCSPFRPKVLASGGNPKLPHFTHQPAIEPPRYILMVRLTVIYFFLLSVHYLHIVDAPFAMSVMYFPLVLSHIHFCIEVQPSVNAGDWALTIIYAQFLSPFPV